MVIANSYIRVVSLGAMLAMGGALYAADDTPPKPDNSKANKQAEGATTADQQKMNPEDRDLAKKVRKAITSDKSLSTYAHNVKVIARDGTITLKGPVRTEEEKITLEAKATEVVGAGKVTNELTVAPKS
ncbi:MAG TPA: BON domain-containing protein [Bryobacteraceae bacterium]|nr:BON domain-containing protein [Bryobacteraceae bacterium]